MNFNRYLYHIILVSIEDFQKTSIISIVVVIINVLTLSNFKVLGNFIYILDMTYVGNSIHFISLAVTDQGVMIKDEERK